MITPLRILMLEDCLEDAELLLYQLKRASFAPDCQIVDTREDFIAGLSWQPDIILADYCLPQFDAISALRLLKQRDLDIPFIIVSGTIGENQAVDAMKEGAADYLLKDRLPRLGQAISHALCEQKMRLENQQAQEQLRRQFERMTALREMEVALASNLNLSSMLNFHLDQIMRLLGVDAVAILLLSPESGCLEYAAGAGFNGTVITSTRLLVGEGLDGRAAQERRPVSSTSLQDLKEKFVRAELLKDEAFVEYYAVPLIAREQLRGVLEVFHRKESAHDPDWPEFLGMIAQQSALAIQNASLIEDLHRANEELTSAYDATLAGWSHAIDLRDKDTEGHSQRVTQITLRLAEAMGLQGESLQHIRRGALLHDIGKLGIPDSILLKPDLLTPDEWKIMHRHPKDAYNMLSPIAFLRPALDIPYCHHEKWDGTGYPRGLREGEIPLAARIFAVVDVWDALRSDRSYRKKWPAAQVRSHIQALSGSHFDPEVVNAFLQLEI